MAMFCDYCRIILTIIFENMKKNFSNFFCFNLFKNQFLFIILTSKIFFYIFNHSIFWGFHLDYFRFKFRLAQWYLNCKILIKYFISAIVKNGVIKKFYFYFLAKKFIYRKVSTISYIFKQKQMLNFFSHYPLQLFNIIVEILYLH